MKNHELFNKIISNFSKEIDSQLDKFFENDPDKDKKIKYIKDHGGYCDCEVAMNVCLVDLY